jgi:hypothetical protein
MSNQFLKLRRSAVPGKVPETSSLEYGEIALNTYDGLAFMKKSGSSGEEVVTIGSTIGTGSFATTGSNQFNGNQTITGSLIQGLGSTAIGENSHAEGDSTQAIGLFSHAEGLGTIAYGGRSHAEGQDTIASGSYSHAEGYQTIALADHQHVQGQFNATSSVPAAFIVGNGTDDSNRSNLIYAAGNEVQISGSVKVFGSITGSLFGTASWAQNAVTASYLEGYISPFPFTGSGQITGSLGVTGSVSISGSQGDLFTANIDTLLLTGSLITTGSMQLTGSMNVLGSITSSLFGTASWAQNFLTSSVTSASYALTASYVASVNIDTGSFATTGSNIFKGNQTISGSIYLNSGSIILANGARISDSGENALAFGIGAGITQQSGAIAIGDTAGLSQGYQAIAIGTEAAGQGGFQSEGAIAIGTAAGGSEQGLYAIAIGSGAGQISQSILSIAIGQDAGRNSQTEKTIIINATGTVVDSIAGQSSSLYIAPIRRASGTEGVLQYNSSSREVTYSNTISGSINVSGSITASSFTGSLFGTSSFAVSASQAISSSFITGSNVFGPYGSNSILSASYAQTASYAVNIEVSGSINNVDYIDFNTSATVTQPVAGRLSWNNSDGTLDLGMKGANVTQQIGQEIFYEIRNQTTSSILNGTSLYANGVTAGSGRITAAPFVADGTTEEARYLGLATENISTGVNGFVTHFGYVRGLDTRGDFPSSIAVGDELWSVGDILYAHPTVPGKLTIFPPKDKIYVAFIIIRHQSTGVLFVRPSSFGHLDDLHDVDINTGSLSSGDLLLYDSGSDYWINSRQLTGSYGLTGSLTAINGGFTGSLFGTASHTLQSLSSSYALSASYGATSSYADSFYVQNDAIISGSLTIYENLTIFGSASITYISESTLNVGTSLITVNSNTPAVRFGGLAVIDSGSIPQKSGSWLFDSTQDRWIMIHQNPVGSSITSSIGIMGPETYDNLGSETQITANRLTKGYTGLSGEHIGDSQISDNGTTVSIPGKLVVTGSITGSLFGTASFAVFASQAQNAVSSSYPIAITGSNLYSTNPIAGVPNPSSISDSIFFGGGAGNLAVSASYSNFLGFEAGYLVSNANNSNFLGFQAGFEASNAGASNFLGAQAGASASNANNSNFLGAHAGYLAVSASYSNLIGYRTGLNTAGAGIGSNNIIIGTNITLANGVKDSINLGAIIFATGSYSDPNSSPYEEAVNGRVGINQSNPRYGLDVSGSGNYTNGLIVTGSLLAPTITGSLLGTASFATTASFASTASSADNFTVRGTLTAITIVAQTITASTEFITGSSKFGSLVTDTHQFTGSVSISGSLTMPIFSSGSVIFAGANGILSQSNSNLFWDNTNGRLGIGTTTPTNPLQVNGAVRATSLIGSTSATLGGTSAANASAVIDIISTTKGLLPPRTNLTSNIAIPVQGLITYLTGSTNEGLYYYSSGSIKAWTRLLNDTGSQIISGSLDVTTNITATSFTGSLLGTASYATNALTASYVLNAVSASFATNANLLDNLDSTAFAQLASANTFTNNQVITGSVNITGSLTINGGEIFAGRIDNGNEGGQVSFGRALDNNNGWYIDVYGNTSTPSLRFVDVSTAAVRMTISGSGAITMGQSLAVGPINPSAVAGRIDASNDVVAFSTSDSRFKENIQVIPNALDKIDKIHGYTFDWKEDKNLNIMHGFVGHDVGVIAQEIELVLPEVVTTRDNGYKAVKYEKIVPLLIQAIKEQQKEINELRETIKNKL